MPEALFDRVDNPTPGELPEHLQGKTPREVAEYYQRREQTIRQELQPPANPPTNPPVNPAPPAAPPPGMTAGQAQTMIQGAIMVAKSNCSAHVDSEGKPLWDRYWPEVQAIVQQMPLQSQMDASLLVTVFEKVLGTHIADLTREARDIALRPPSMESSSPATPPSAPRVLTTEESRVVAGFARAGAMACEMTEDGKVKRDAAGKPLSRPFDQKAYLDGEAKSKAGTWPMTFANY